MKERLCSDAQFHFSKMNYMLQTLVNVQIAQCLMMGKKFIMKWVVNAPTAAGLWKFRLPSHASLGALTNDE